MKKTFKSLAAAAAFACATPVLAQTATTAPSAEATKAAADICTAMAADKDEPIVCTADQSKKLAELIERVKAMPVTDRYSALAQRYELIEGIRQIFFPTEAPIAKPPKDQFEEAAMGICAQKKQATGVACSDSEFNQVKALAVALAAMPEPTTVEELQERQQFIRDGLSKIFPGAIAPAAPAAPAQDSAPLRRMNIA